MGRVLSLGFEFMGEQRQTVIRVKEINERIEYQITVLDEELAQLLADNNVIVEEDDCLRVDMPVQLDKPAMLKEMIAEALGRYLKKTTRIQIH